MNTAPVFSAYSHESCLPCELDEVVIRVRRRKLDASLSDKVGLSKDILAVPLSEGFFLCARDLALVSNTIEPLPQLDGTRTLGEVLSSPMAESALEQLHYYRLLSFGPNGGSLRMPTIEPRYLTQYQGGGFVIFSLVPLSVEIDITNACNFRCIHCLWGSGPENRLGAPGELTTDEIFGIISECAQLGVPNLQLMGGEPLAHPDFLNFVRHAKESGILFIKTSTDGWLVRDQMARELAKYLDSIQVSIHGASSLTHDRIVGRRGAWDQARKAVRLLKESGLRVNVSFTVMRENVTDVEEMPHLATEWGADSLRFLRLITQGRGAALQGWTEEEVIQLGDKIRRINYDLGSRLLLDAGGFPPLASIKNDASFYGCDAGTTLMSIASDGGVTACGSLGRNYIGNVRSQSLLDIWHSPHFVEMRRQPDCMDCSYRSICWGPCRVPC